jgi:hypothetical protein
LSKDKPQTSFTATLHQIKSEPAGGWRITLDVSDNDTEQVMELSKMRDCLLSIGVVLIG